MQVTSKEYQEHKIFEELENYANFYNDLSYSIMGFITLGTKSILNIDTHVYSSMSGTLDSIKIILRHGRINDAFALQRKFYDSLLMDVYVNLYLENNHSIDNFIVEKIQGWIQGTDQLPNSRGMINYIKDSSKIAKLYLILNKDDRYDKIRNRGNDNTHYNFYRNVMLNDNQVYIKHRIEYLNALLSDIKQLIIMHLSFIFYLNQHYMVSSDYADYLEINQTPPEDCQYWVAPFIQKIFDELIKKHRADIAAYIKENTSMQLN